MVSGSNDRIDIVLKRALQYRVQLLAYARSLLGDYTEAEDVIQEALLVVVKKADQFQEGTSMLAWCRAIVRLEVLRARQQQRRQPSLNDRLLEDAGDAAFEEATDGQGVPGIRQPNAA